MRWSFATICTTILWCIFVASSETSNGSENQIVRTKRHIKETVSKDGSSRSVTKDKKVQDLSTRLELLESKVEAMDEKEESDNNLLKTLQDGFANASKREDLMEKQIQDLSEKLQDVEGSLGADESYWSYSTECGDVLVSQMGKIAHTEPYRSGPVFTRSSCIWTIRANHRSRIQVLLTSLNPHVIVTEFVLRDDGSHTVNHTKIASTRVYLFNGPVIFVTSLTRTIGLSFSGQGKKVHENTEFRHEYYNYTTGSYTFNAVGQRSRQPPGNGTYRTFTTMVTRIDPSNLVELDVTLPSNGCANATFHVQTGDDDFHGANGRVKNNSACCFGNPTSCNSRRYTLDGWFASSYSTLVPNVNELSLNWKARTNQSDSIDKCGGILMGKGGKISYKKFSTYTNNERCIWVIYPFPKNSVKIVGFTSGFESSHDHVTVLEVDKEGGSSTSLSPSLYTTKNYTGRVILVTFYSDTSVVRQGFDLLWEAVGPSDFSRSLESEKILHNSLKHTKSSDVALLSQGFALHVITNPELDGSSLNLTVKRMRSVHCPSSRLKMFGTTEGHLSTADGNPIINPCTTVANFPVWNISSPDGIGIVFLDNKDSQGKVQIEASWNFVLPDPADVAVQDKCGGVIQRVSGRLNYKLDGNYENSERCIWLIHSPTSSEIRLTLAKEGFELCCDYILVNTIDPNTGRLNNFTGVITRENNTQVFPGNLVIVTFRSDASVTGKGFSLVYIGQGQRSGSAASFKLKHLDEVVGSYHYQRNELGSDGWGDSRSDNATENNQLSVIAYSTGTESGEGNSVVIFNVTVSDITFGVDDNCKSDVLNLYSTPSREGFTLGESYPKLECQLTNNGCGNCVANKLTGNDTTLHTFSSAFRAFVGIYKPVTSSAVNNQSFHIRWDSSSGCGGVEQQDEGRIGYKTNSRYKNLEQCIWTVHIPTADKIRFSLLNNGFEACCDNIILTPLDPKTGALGASRVLKSGQTNALMTGPVVFVTFRTDASVTGEGFSLTYTGIPSAGTSTIRNRLIDYYTETEYNWANDEYENSSVTTTSHPRPPPSIPTFNYYHYHVHRRNSSFTYPSGLGPNDILTVTFSPEPSRNESFVHMGSAVRIKNLDLQVNNETCISDSLRFFESWTKEGFNASSSFSVPIPDTSNCQSAGQWGCDNCLSNQTEADQKKGVVTQHPAFIVIYKSVTPSGESRNNSFRIEWTDFHRITETTTSTIRPIAGRIGLIG